MSEHNFDHLREKLQQASDDQAEASPLESVLNLPAGSTPTFQDMVPEVKVGEMTDPTTGEIVVQQVDDLTPAVIQKEERIEDLQIAAKQEEVYVNAMTAFEQQIGNIGKADPKFAARNGEVAAQFLKIALDAANSKVEAKYKRAKIRYAEAAASRGPNVQNNVVVADRNDVLKALFGNRDMEKRDIEGTILDDVTK
jgi:hypothetical protein